MVAAAGESLSFEIINIVSKTSATEGSQPGDAPGPDPRNCTSYKYCQRRPPIRQIGSPLYFFAGEKMRQGAHI